MRAILLACVLLWAGPAEAQSFIRYHAPRVPNEAVGSNSINGSFWDNGLTPLMMSFEREVPLTAWSGTTAPNSGVLLMARTNTNLATALNVYPFYRNFSSVAYNGAEINGAAGNSAYVQGGYFLAIDEGTGDRRIRPQAIEAYGVCTGASTRTCGAHGFYGGAYTATTTALEYIYGAEFFVYAAATSAITKAIASLQVTGPWDTDACGTDIQKCFKIRTSDVGRNYFVQTDDVGLYAAEVRGDKGLLAGGKNGQIQLSDDSTKPTCEAATRGSFWYEAGGAGVADTVEVCRKDAGDAYAWVSVI